MKFPFLVITLFVLALSGVAQSPAKILRQAEKALGGTKALQQITSWRKSGTITRVEDGLTGKIVYQTSRPNLYNLSIDIDGFEIETGFNGKSGWMRDSRNGLRTLTGEASTDFQAEAAFQNTLWLNAKKDKAKIVASGKSEVAGKPVDVLTLSTAKGSTIKLFLDLQTGLPVREEFASGDSVRVFEFSDYRPVQGVKQPYRVRIELGGNVYDAVFDDIRANERIARTEFDFPNISSEPLPDIPTLLKELQANEDKVENMLDTYSYIQKHIRREIGKDGTLRETGSETFQLSFYKGYRMSRMIEKNGKPLSPSDQADQDRDAAKRAEEIEKKIAKREANPEAESETERGRRVSVAEVLRASKLLNPRRERFRGRDVIVFDFEPNPSFDFKNAKSMLKFFGKVAGAMWIDEKDKQVARLEAFLFDSYKIGGGMVAKLKKGASFTLEQERVNDEIWLPSTADINMSVRVFLVKGIDLNAVIRSYDYRKFTTEVKDAKVNPTEQP
jgi:outer membrane lipoprotein-sorting protein